MLVQTHLIAGQCAFLGLCVATGHVPTHAETLAAMVAATIPDLDKRTSYVGRLLPPLSEWLEYRWGHRTLTHSLLLQGLVGGALYPFLPEGFWLALVAGWVSHTGCDMLTLGGVAWFWPSRVRCIFPGNPAYRFEAASFGELAFAAALVALTFPLLAWAGQGTGTTGLIREALGRIDSARQEYDAAKGANVWNLEVQGKDNRSFAAVRGTFPVRGPWQETGFIVDNAGQPVSVCAAAGCDWYAERAVLTRGPAEATTALKLSPGSTSGAALAARWRPLTQAGTVYVSGALETRAGKPAPPTVTGSETTLALHFASLDELARIGPVVASELVVQVRHPPGVAVPAIDTKPAPPGRDPILRRWVNPAEKE